MKKLFLLLAIFALGFTNLEAQTRHSKGVIIGDKSGTSADPVGTKEGEIQWNNTLKKFRYFDGTNWFDLVGAGGGSADGAITNVTFSGTTLTFTGTSTAFNSTVNISSAFSDYMRTSIYDPTNVADDAFQVGNHIVDDSGLNRYSGFTNSLLLFEEIDSDITTYTQSLSDLEANVLQLDNTTAFTPDADYEPATKKYVDDNTSSLALTLTDTEIAFGSALDLLTSTPDFTYSSGELSIRDPVTDDASISTSGGFMALYDNSASQFSYGDGMIIVDDSAETISLGGGTSSSSIDIDLSGSSGNGEFVFNQFSDIQLFDPNNGGFFIPYLWMDAENLTLSARGTASTDVDFIIDMDATLNGALSINGGVGVGTINTSSLTADRTYALPDTSGTIALSESSEWYQSTGTRVGGDLLVKMGDYDDTNNSTKLIIDDDGENIKLYASGSIDFNGFGDFKSGLRADTFTLTNGAFEGTISPTTLTALRAYELPDASGTLALTDVDNTFSVDQTFDGFINFQSEDSFIGIDGSDYLNLFGDSGIKLESSDGLSLYLSDEFSLEGTQVLAFGATNMANINSSSLTAERTYTLPDAGGTLALTSDISAGGNLQSVLDNGTTWTSSDTFGTFTISPDDGNGNISYFNTDADWGYIFNAEEGLSFTNSGGVTAGLSALNSDFLKVGNYSYASTLRSSNLTANRAFQFPDSDGTLALTSDTDLQGVLDNGNTSTTDFTLSSGNFTNNLFTGQGIVTTQDVTISGTSHLNLLNFTDLSANSMNYKAFIENDVLQGLGWGATGSAYDLFIERSTGDVGIGTSDPTAALDVNGNITVGTGDRIYSDRFQSLSGALTLTDGNIGITVSGNNMQSGDSYMNIGREGFRYNSLFIDDGEINTNGQIVSNITPTASGNDIRQILTTSPYNIKSTYTANAYHGGMLWSTSDADPTKPFAGIYTQKTSSGSKMFLKTSNAYVLGLNTDANGIIIDYEGKLGIGTASPTEKLEVNGNALIKDGVLSLDFTGQTSQQMVFSGVGSNTHSIGGGATLQLNHDNITSPSTLRLAYGSANKYVSLGTAVSANNARLFVKGSGNDNTTTAFRIDNSDDNTLLSVKNNGDVIIGDYTLPNTDGTSNQVLKTDGSGTVTWYDEPEGITTYDNVINDPLDLGVGNNGYSANGNGVSYLATADVTFNKIQFKAAATTNNTKTFIQVYKSSTFGSSQSLDTFTLLHETSQIWNNDENTYKTVLLDEPIDLLDTEYLFVVFSTKTAVDVRVKYWDNQPAGLTDRIIFTTSSDYGNIFSDTWYEGSSVYHNVPITLSMIDKVIDEENKITIPSEIVAVEGIELNLYLDALVNTEDNGLSTLSNVEIICSKGIIKDRMWQYTPLLADVGTHTMTINYYVDNKVKETKTVDLVVINDDAPVSSKNIINVGDSITAEATGEITKTIRDNFVTIGGTTPTFVGTEGTAPNEHEGNGGYTFANFVGVTSPFYDGAEIDITDYRTTNSVTNPFDVATIQLGVNDSFEDDVNTAQEIKDIIKDAKELIDDFIADSGSTKILIALPTIDGNTYGGWSEDYDATKSKKVYKQNIFKLRNAILEHFDNGIYDTDVKVVIAGLVIDRYYGYDLVDVASSSRIITTEKTHDNALHPADDGLEQIGDSYFAYILREIQ